MKRLILFFTGTLFFCLFFLASQAQVNFSASIYPQKIGTDEYTTLRLMVENAVDVQQIRPPSLKDFKVISGPNQESGMSSVNGVVKQYIALTYVLQPKTKGVYTLGKASAIIDGHSYNSNPIQIRVIQGATNPQGNQAYTAPQALSGLSQFMEEPTPRDDYKDYVLHKNENIPDKVNKNMVLRLQTDKTSCYVGEPVVASYKLYTRLKSDSKLTKNPSFNGFSVIDLQAPATTAFSQEVLNGRPYNVYTIRKTQLYPLQAGDISLESASVENNVQFIKEGSASSGNRGIFEDLLGAQGEVITQTVTLNSKPVVINVKPLPAEGKPANFSGAVGHFSISTQINKSSFSTDESGNLQVTISGAGNMHLINAPEVIWPEGIDGFDPKTTDKYNNMVVPLQGDKIFDFSFSVQRAGDFTLPSVKFSYFDPAAQVYKTITSKPYVLHITQGKNPVRRTANVLAANGNENNNGLQYGLYALGALVLAIFIILLTRRRKSKIKESVVQEEIKIAERLKETPPPPPVHNFLAFQNPLPETEACLQQDECIDFYGILNKELRHFLAVRFSLNEAVLNNKKIAAAMDATGVDNSTILSLEELMHEIEWRLYTPFERTQRLREFYNRSMQVIQEINTSMTAHVTL
ncbi:MAG: BatD family protein [Ferruginibacter sp.]